MMKYMIIEDEYILGKRLERMISQVRGDYSLVSRTAGVEESVRYLSCNDPDLVFMDIELADGNCFEIFDRVDISSPVIFTTAYNEHAIKAFKVNSIDYLLKPIENLDLVTAIEKFEDLRHMPAAAPQPAADYRTVGEIVSPKSLRERLLISKGNNFIFVQMSEVAFFFSNEKYTNLYTFDGHKYLIDKTLNQLEEELDRKTFFRIRRNCLLNIHAVKTIHKFLNGRLKITLDPRPDFEIIVSQARRDDFLRWVDGEII